MSETNRPRTARSRRGAPVKIAACAIGLTLLAIAAPATQQPDFHPNIPKAWDDKEVESMELPLAQRDRSPGPIEGHEKGLDLSPEDRKALIAFLKTL